MGIAKPVIKITEVSTSLFYPVLNFFVHFSIIGYNGGKIGEIRNGFQQCGETGGGS